MNITYDCHVLPAQWPSGRLSALRLQGCGFDPELGHAKDFKSGIHCLPAWRSVFRVGLGGVRGPDNFQPW